MALPLGLLLALSPVSAAAVPPEFEGPTQVVAVNSPTALAFTPNGRMLITTKAGKLWVHRDGDLPNEKVLALDLSNRICADFERGLLGVAVDPDFGTNRFIYLYYTFNKHDTCKQNTANSPVNRVSRFRLGANDKVRAGSETILINNIPSPNGNHNGGDLQFGGDKLLYVSVGDGGCDLKDPTRCAPDNRNARRLHLLLGKILRITRNGGIPGGNPYADDPAGVRCNQTGRTTMGKLCEEIFATGLRNPFRIAFDQGSSRFFINDVGQNAWEEIDEGEAEADYGRNIG